jgi:hypothetical protein
MDTFRRRSHRTVAEHRGREVEKLLADVLEQYRWDVTVGHPCDSCATNVAIYERRARTLGVEVEDPPT